MTHNERIERVQRILAARGVDSVVARDDLDFLERELTELREENKALRRALAAARAEAWDQRRAVDQLRKEATEP